MLVCWLVLCPHRSFACRQGTRVDPSLRERKPLGAGFTPPNVSRRSLGSAELPRTPHCGSSGFVSGAPPASGRSPSGARCRAPERHVRPPRTAGACRLSRGLGDVATCSSLAEPSESWTSLSLWMPLARSSVTSPRAQARFLIPSWVTWPFQKRGPCPLSCGHGLGKGPRRKEAVRAALPRGVRRGCLEGDTALRCRDGSPP